MRIYLISMDKCLEKHYNFDKITSISNPLFLGRGGEDENPRFYFLANKNNIGILEDKLMAGINGDEFSIDIKKLTEKEIMKYLPKDLINLYRKFGIYELFLDKKTISNLFKIGQIYLKELEFI